MQTKGEIVRSLWVGFIVKIATQELVLHTSLNFSHAVSAVSSGYVCNRSISFLLVANNGNDAALKIDSTIECFSLNSSSYKKFLIRTSFGNTNDPPKLVYEHNLAIADATQSVINNIKIQPSSGNLASGKIKLFGLK